MISKRFLKVVIVAKCPYIFFPVKINVFMLHLVYGYVDSYT